MGANKNRQMDFVEIVKKAYDRGTKDNSVTVQKLLDELKISLRHIYKP